jgi:hypothetical protein
MTALRLAHDTDYAAAPVKFWLALILQLVHAAILLRIAGSRLRRQISQPALHLPTPRPPAMEAEGGESTYSLEPASNASYLAANPPAPPKLRPPRRHGFPAETDPLEWLVQRQRGQRALCWVAAVVFVFSGLGFSLGFLMKFFTVTAAGGVPLALYSIYQLSWLVEAMLAWAACRFFFEARRSGELELLLTTPAGARTLVSAHWAAMRRLLFRPMVVMVTPLLLQGGCSALMLLPGRAGGTAPYQLYSSLHVFFRAADLVLIVIALNWLGMLFGLTMRRLVSAVGLTMGLVMGVPMILHSVFQFATRPFLTPNPGSTGWLVWTLSYYPIQWVCLLALTLWARQQLRRGRAAELFPMDWLQSVKESVSQCVSAVRRFRRLARGA